MIAIAAKANIPIIAITTSDVMNASTVLSHIVEATVTEWPIACTFEVGKAASAKLKSFDFFYTKDSAFECNEPLYNWLVSHEKVLFLINHEGSPFSFDGGELPTPPELVSKVLSSIMEKDDVDACLPALQGLTLKSVSELIRLTSVGGTVSNRTLTSNKWMVSSQVQGLETVDKSLGVYLPSKPLVEYADLNQFYFNKQTPYQLRPRGLLLAGESGVGKSLGAKYLANAFDCSLYRLDLSASLGRYVGQSEQAVNRVLSAVKANCPCVLLIDEIEKLFGESDDSGVTYRLLAQLLWFLQEHRDLILTVMTTNDVEKLPPELYRPGRIDRVINMQPLSTDEMLTLASSLYASFGLNLADHPIDKLHQIHRTQANIVACVHDHIKANNLLTNSKH